MSFVDALPIGAQVDQYVIEAVLGQGGFGIVYRARHPVHGSIALKEFFPKSQASRISGGSIVPSNPRSEEAFTKGVERLLAEGQKLKGFKHDNIIQVIDVFENNDTAYLVMELIDGPTLQAAVDSKTLTPDRAMVEGFADQMLDALGLVHSAGLIHRDLAPDNILVDLKSGPPRFVLIDFGGAKRVVTDVSESSSRSLTKTGFSAPEQYGSECAGGIKASPATDVYGLAATLYWLISGKKPIDAPNRVIQDTLVRLSSESDLLAIYGRNFLSAVDYGLGLRPDARPSTAEAFRKALEEGVKLPTEEAGGGSRWLIATMATLLLVILGVGTGGYMMGWWPAGGKAAPANAASTSAPVEAEESAAPPVAVQTQVVRETVYAEREEPQPQVALPTQAPPRAPVCRTVNDVQRRCTTAYRTERECGPEDDYETVYTDGSRPLSGWFPSQSSAESMCRSQARSIVRSALNRQCDGSLSDITVDCYCDWDPDSPTGASCDYDGEAECSSTKNVCRDVNVPYQNCQDVNVPRQVCE